MGHPVDEMFEQSVFENHHFFSHTVAIKKTRHLVNLPYKPGISN